MHLSEGVEVGPFRYCSDRRYFEEFDFMSVRYALNGLMGNMLCEAVFGKPQILCRGMNKRRSVFGAGQILDSPGGCPHGFGLVIEKLIVVK
jgi:hypothetical protein